jgi:hypothetical protein
MKKLLVAILAVAMFTVGCSTTWVTQALEIVAALTPAITNIVPLVALADKNVNPTDISTIQNYSAQASNALQTVGSLINQYNQAATAAQQQDVLSKIHTALLVAQQSLESVLPQLHISNPKSQAAIAVALGAAISEIGSIQAILPALKAGRTAEAVSLARPISANSFRSRYNKAISPIPGSDKLKLRGKKFLYVF